MLSPFVLLADPNKYVACSWDLSQDDQGRVHWVDFFKRHVNTILNLGVEAAVVRGEQRANAVQRAINCREEFCKFFDDYAADPNNSARWGVSRVTIITLDEWRDQLLRRHGFIDAFIDLKDRENEKALPLLPTVCRQIDLLTSEEQFRAVIEGVFAGNIFDMGAEATANAYLNASPDFFATRKSLAPRPWLVDDFDLAMNRFVHGTPKGQGRATPSPGPYRKAVFFIDNAGSDFLLGAIPMMRWLAMRGTAVVMAANERPTLNDMTIHDVRRWWPRIIEVEPSLKTLPIQVISTGTGEPLIDLSGVSPELNEAAADADLVVLEGMGRGVESNLDVAMRCDVMNLAMIKDIMVARRNGGKLFDVVCRYRPLDV
jgi:type II pantothenate kinase